MKNLKLILAMVIFTMPVFSAAQDKNSETQAKQKKEITDVTQGKSTAPAQTKRIIAWDKLSPLERYKQGAGANIKSRKIKITPINQTTGISTGLVIAYGHIIPPPYKIYIENNSIMVNGIQVSPSLVWEREVRAQSNPILSLGNGVSHHFPGK